MQPTHALYLEFVITWNESKFNTTGVITLSELDWITNNQSEFSRLDMALVLKIGRLMDEGIIELDCRLQA